jgi:hypothetical protein
MIAGIEVEMGGTYWTVPPLSLGAVERFAPVLGKPGGLQVGLVIDMALASLKRNYPDLDRERVADLIDTENVQRVFEAIMGVSGLVPKENAAPGKPKRPTPRR